MNVRRHPDLAEEAVGTGIAGHGEEPEQGNWKITSKLTLDIGIRYDHFTNPVGYADNGTSLTAITGSFLPPTGPMATNPNTCTVPTASSTSTVAYAECQLGVYTNVKHVFANNPNAQNWELPIGFAYDPYGDHKTSVRGGFGIFHDPVSARIYQSGYTGSAPAPCNWRRPVAFSACITPVRLSESDPGSFQLPGRHSGSVGAGPSWYAKSSLFPLCNPKMEQSIHSVLTYCSHLWSSDNHTWDPV